MLYDATFFAILLMPPLRAALHTMLFFADAYATPMLDYYASAFRRHYAMHERMAARYAAERYALRLRLLAPFYVDFL